MAPVIGRLPESARRRVADVVLRVAPWVLVEPVVDVLGWAIATGMRRLRRPGVMRARENLTVVLGSEVPERVLAASLRQYYEHWVSMLRMPALGVAGVSAAVDLTGVENLPSDRSAVLVSCHMGRYEWGSAALSTAIRERTGRGLLGVARVFGSPVTESVIHRVRAAGGNSEMEWVDPSARSRTAAALMTRLREGGIVGMMIDRYSVGATVEVPMFGRRVALAAAPVALAVRTGSALLPMTCWVARDGRVHFDVHPEISTSGTVPEVLESVAAVFEKEIAAHPEAWHVTSPVFR
ncbi:lysophospholipid acyltransferase family protein [Actinomycetospora termitidis]|uniref:Acyltransferase n=1 Tax=Actinomycetospora termitidis TaxID=3053470 RepID=A0ABT7MFW5_9PSEU|nr:hypothetical protein [Actinomycetospora sp. Odt1-22]MDL5159558.1 hypothetical protein [Actinomycetospora sp. Odt1-22]